MTLLYPVVSVYAALYKRFSPELKIISMNLGYLNS